MQILGKIVAPSDLDAWKDFDAENWLLFSNVSGLVIQGNGEIDGQGAAWWDRKSDGRPTVRYYLPSPFQFSLVCACAYAGVFLYAYLTSPSIVFTW